MTIPTNLPIRELNRRLSNLEYGTENAPEGTFETAKAAAQVVDDISNEILKVLRAAGFKALNDDRLRTVEAALYGYILESNPDAFDLITAEGFGAGMDGPAAERVLDGILRDRDSLARIAARDINTINTP